MMDDQERSIAFGQRLQQRMSTDVEAFEWGTAYLDEDFPLRYGSNLLWVEGEPEVDGQALIAAADQILGGRGHQHRVILVDPHSLFHRLTPDFHEQGWSANQYVLMVHRPNALLPGDLPDARQLSHPEALPLIESHVRAVAGRDEATVRTLADYPGKLERQVGARLFVAEADGTPAASCELYLDGPEAQVESVQTLESHRGRRLGTAVVVGALQAARHAGAEWIHLYADEGGWQVGWYERLGFERVGSFGEFSRYPDA